MVSQLGTTVWMKPIRDRPLSPRFCRPRRFVNQGTETTSLAFTRPSLIRFFGHQLPRRFRKRVHYSALSILPGPPKIAPEVGWLSERFPPDCGCTPRQILSVSERFPAKVILRLPKSPQPTSGAIFGGPILPPLPPPMMLATWLLDRLTPTCCFCSQMLMPQRRGPPLVPNLHDFDGGNTRYRVILAQAGRTNRNWHFPSLT